MERQEMLNHMYKFLLKQGGPAIARHKGDSIGTTCMYRLIKGNEVLCCAVGALIPPYIYNPEMECKGIDSHEMSQEIIDYLGEQNIEFLREIQYIHDGWSRTKITCPDLEWSEYITKGFSKVAKEYDLALEEGSDEI